MTRMSHRPSPASRAPPGRAGGWREDAAVSDVVGSILLVAMTVAVAAGFGILLLSFDGPADTLHVDVELRTTPGDDGDWGTGDERFQLLHLGGEPLDKDDTTLRYTADGTEHEYEGDGLGSFFDDDGDGLLTIGEAWVSPAADPLDVEQDEAVRATLLTTTADDTELLAAGTVTGGGIELTATSCLPDITAPSGAFTQSPADVTSLSSGSVTVTLTVSDSCTGVDTAAAPTFSYCIATTCTVPTSFSAATPMTDGTAGDRVWTATIPAQVWLTEGVAGKSVQYYASGMKDLAGNTAQTSVKVDAIDLIVTYQYVASASATTGTVASLANAQAASANDGVSADLAEGGVAGSPVSVGPTKYFGTTATNSGALNPTNVLASDETRTEFDSNGDSLELTGIDLPDNANTVTAVTIGFEGRKASNGGTSPALRLDYKLGSGGTYSTGSAQTITNAVTDSDYTRTLSGITTVAQAESLYVRLVYSTDTNRNPQVDAVFVTVTYTSTPQTEYRMDIQLEWTGVSDGLSETLQLRYRVQDDTFTVKVYNHVTTAWRTCGVAGGLSSTSLDTFTCALQANEISAVGGDVFVQITDVTTTGTTAGHLYLDHARLALA